MSPRALEMIIHTFIFKRLDYCNSLYTSVNQALLNRLQHVQNAVSRLLTDTREREHIKPILISLHWLPVKFRIHLKLLI